MPAPPETRAPHSPRLGPGARRLLWAMIAVGLFARVVLAFKTYGVVYDIDSLKAVRAALDTHPLHVYTTVNGHPDNRWPYPPGFFPWVAAAGGLANLTGLAFHGWIQLPQIAADGAIAWLVQDFLGRRGAGERVRLVAAGLVALGPSFWIISGFHGQIDSLAILPCVIALWLWDRSAPGTRRAVAAGLLIGVGASIKSVPILMLFALLPSVRSRREALALVAPAVAVPLVLLSPWLVADPHGTIHALQSHRALPGFGGIGLLAQPAFADQWLHQHPHVLTPLSSFLLHHATAILAVLMAPFIALVLVRRVEPVLAAALLWPAVILLNPGFGFQYVVWALPFVLMAGYIREVAAVQAALLIPAAIIYWHPFGHAPIGVYVPIMLGAWAVATAAVVVLAVRIARQEPQRARAAP